jgi:hypothetical protein
MDHADLPLYPSEKCDHPSMRIGRMLYVYLCFRCDEKGASYDSPPSERFELSISVRCKCAGCNRAIVSLAVAGRKPLFKPMLVALSDVPDTNGCILPIRTILHAAIIDTPGSTRFEQAFDQFSTSYPYVSMKRVVQTNSFSNTPIIFGHSRPVNFQNEQAEFTMLQNSHHFCRKCS